jgi:hypothetical protein
MGFLSFVVNLPSKLGSAISANSLPVVIASDQTVPVSASSLPLPTGAATSANQATEITSLATIATNTTGASTAANQATANTALAAIQTSVAGTLAVKTPISAPVAGQVAIATIATAEVLGSGVLTNGVVIKAGLANTGTILVGAAGVTDTNNGTGNGYPLSAGEAISIAAANLSQVYINGTTAGDFVSYVGN